MTSDTRHIIATNAVGGEYYSLWDRNSRSNWTNYAETFGIGIAIFKRDIALENPKFDKKAPWQKLLIPELLFQRIENLQKVALVDTDVTFSPVARNLFEHSGDDGVGVVSQVNELPFDLDQVKRKLAFLRNKRFSSAYPLDSSLFMPATEFVEHMGLQQIEDYFCSGVVVLNESSVARQMHEWYFRVSANDALESQRKFGMWEEPYLNSWVQNETRVHWMPYSFQALWTYEMAAFYPFGFKLKETVLDPQISIEVLEAVLLNHDVVHFAGGWHESHAWHQVPMIFQQSESFEIREFQEYQSKPVFGKPLGKILPEGSSWS